MQSKPRWNFVIQCNITSHIMLNILKDQFTQTTKHLISSRLSDISVNFSTDSGGFVSGAPSIYKKPDTMSWLLCY